jgi:hypothetical protein
MFRYRSIQSIILELDTLLDPYALSENAKERRADLTALSERGERLGLSILSQPAVWEFRWDNSEESRYELGNSTRQKNLLVVFPGFQRITDHKARRLDSPHVALEQQTYGNQLAGEMKDELMQKTHCASDFI